MSKLNDAISILEDNPIDKENESYPSQQLTQAMYQVQNEKPKTAHQLLKNLNKRDAWYEKQLGIEWLMHKKFLEIIVFIELEYLDLVESRIKSILKIHSKVIKEHQNKEVKPFIKIIKKLINNLNSVNETEIKEMIIKEGLTEKSFKEADLFFLSYYAWLKSKWNKKGVYQNIMEIIKMNQ